MARWSAKMASKNKVWRDRHARLQAIEDAALKAATQYAIDKDPKFWTCPMSQAIAYTEAANPGLVEAYAKARKARLDLEDAACNAGNAYQDSSYRFCWY